LPLSIFSTKGLKDLGKCQDESNAAFSQFSAFLNSRIQNGRGGLNQFPPVRVSAGFRGATAFFRLFRLQLSVSQSEEFYVSEAMTEQLLLLNRFRE
jgi:hypothetical protein